MEEKKLKEDRCG